MLRDVEEFTTRSHEAVKSALTVAQIYVHSEFIVLILALHSQCDG